jgi:hypothetical protein
MATRKEEKERLRQLRVEAEQRDKAAQRRRLMVGYVLAGLIGLVVIAGIVVLVTSSGGGGAQGASHVNPLNPAGGGSGSVNGVPLDNRTGTPPPKQKVTNLDTAAKKAGCVLRLGLTDEGHTHIPPTAKTPNYKTNPPTSGPHVVPPYQQADGAYLKMPKEIDFVHSLEHGRMEIQYSPRLSTKDQLELKGLYDTMYGATLLFPNGKMPYAVAATTWTNLIGCKSYKGSITDDAIRDFGKATWGRYGSEPVSAFGFTGPTPASPSNP